ncbi:spermidine synthase [Pleionea sp. CnH1-48]|uniref:spermidine synthase n=1 Tax=Pleionea sp. CnH1-48 TaxID=2954494 RepID=UPI0020981CDF|nr:fused MFS/spermidine synthase [Pleionea sp. CnH1-48]MCO7226942.1 fused MFS/spermidine synthase [Pleionea sp. CnH1-48]
MIKNKRFGLIAFLLGLLLAHSAHAAKTLQTEKSLYRNIVVIEEGNRRCMIFESRNDPPPYQSCMDLRNKDKLVFNYTKLILSGLLYNPKPKRILVIGLGGGTLPVALNKMVPEAIIESVEIDPAVVKLARKYFHYEDNNKVSTHIFDGRVYVKRALLKKQQYDWIILDAFNGDYIPEHLMTQEYFAELRGLLSDEGIITSNTFSDSRLYDHESVTYHKVFGDFYNLRRRSTGNRIVLAAKSDELVSMNRIKRHANQLRHKFSKFGVDPQWILKHFRKSKDWNEEARSLSDQYSPANLLK